jgi:hypothetical protein
MTIRAIGALVCALGFLCASSCLVSAAPRGEGITEQTADKPAMKKGGTGSAAGSPRPADRVYLQKQNKSGGSNTGGSGGALGLGLATGIVPTVEVHTNEKSGTKPAGGRLGTR